jgi:hypothetical protein
VRRGQSEESEFVLASVVLERLHRAAPKGQVTLGWVLDHLDRQSFGLVLFLLAILAAAPGVCMFAGLLIVASGAQMVVGRHGPYFPQWIANHPLPTQHVGPVVTRAIAVLRWVEKIIHPRWVTAVGKMKPVVGAAVVLLSVRLILVPLPASNLFPALVIAFVSLAYLEQDGLLLSVGLVLAAGILALDAAILREILVGGARL